MGGRSGQCAKLFELQLLIPAEVLSFTGEAATVDAGASAGADTEAGASTGTGAVTSVFSLMSCGVDKASFFTSASRAEGSGLPALALAMPVTPSTDVLLPALTGRLSEDTGGEGGKGGDGARIVVCGGCGDGGGSIGCGFFNGTGTGDCLALFESGWLFRRPFALDELNVRLGGSSNEFEVGNAGRRPCWWRSWWNCWCGRC
mmetsp:Transcript_41532/g.72040  ORF Transcript_41532/g.72040 Transcript_41532/m.72040 type:complete len:202 (-) Transcript_41532:1042-1647(-)